MKNTVFALMTAMLITTPFAKAPLSDEQQHRLVELNLEDKTHVDLERAEQGDLMGKISPKPFAKAPLSDELLHRILALDRLENRAHKALQKAEQAALMGKISSNQLRAVRKQYEVAKEALQAELSKLPNRAEIEQLLIDNHVRVEE